MLMCAKCVTFQNLKARVDWVALTREIENANDMTKQIEPPRVFAYEMNVLSCLGVFC